MQRCAMTGTAKGHGLFLARWFLGTRHYKGKNGLRLVPEKLPLRAVRMQSGEKMKA